MRVLITAIMLSACSTVETAKPDVSEQEWFERCKTRCHALGVGYFSECWDKGWRECCCAGSTGVTP